MRGADLGTLGTEESAGAPERRPMIAMTSRLSLTPGSPSLLHAALPQLVTDRETKLIVGGRPKHSYPFAICCVWTRHGIRDIASSIGR